MLRYLQQISGTLCRGCVQRTHNRRGAASAKYQWLLDRLVSPQPSDRASTWHRDCYLYVECASCTLEFVRRCMKHRDNFCWDLSLPSSFFQPSGHEVLPHPPATGKWWAARHQQCQRLSQKISETGEPNIYRNLSQGQSRRWQNQPLTQERSSPTEPVVRRDPG